MPGRVRGAATRTGGALLTQTREDQMGRVCRVWAWLACGLMREKGEQEDIWKSLLSP